MACPSCTREYEATFEYCPRDARRLVPASEVQEKARGRGSVCADCHRAFDASVSACPACASELLAAPLYEALIGQRMGDNGAGLLARICPECHGQYQLSERFCRRDGEPLAVLN